MTTQQAALFNFETPTMPEIDTSRCYASEINYQTAASMVETFHYAHRVPSIVMAIGMYVDDTLAGCITYGIPPAPNTQRCCGEEYRKNALELNRLYIHDWAGRNSESWLIGQSFAMIDIKKYFVLVSYADSECGHYGGIYRATNWIYTGLTKSHNDVKMKGNKHPRTTQHNGGSLSVLENGGSVVTRSRKYRYVYFLGDKRQRRKLRASLKWPVLPYPKGGPQ